jgi:hypothetical protein
VGVSGHGGASYARQRRVRAAGGSAIDVVDHLVRELASDQPEIA